MNRIVIAIGLVASTFAGSAAFAQPVYPEAPTQVTVPNQAPGVYGGGYDNRFDNQDTQYDNRYGNQHRGDSNRDRWSYLAAVSIDGVRDRDVIVLGRQAGRYDRLMLVPQGRVRVQHAVVTFANGERMSVDLRGGGRNGSVVIDLPGERRAVASVELYAGGRRWGNAQVALYGERGHRRGGWNR